MSKVTEFETQKKQRHQEMKSEVEQWKTQNISINQYCRENALKPTTFKYWIGKIYKEKYQSLYDQSLVKTPTSTTLSLIAKIPANTNITKTWNSTNFNFKLHTKTYELEIGDNFNQAALANILQTIKKIECNFYHQD